MCIQIINSYLFFYREYLIATATVGSLKILVLKLEENEVKHHKMIIESLDIIKMHFITIVMKTLLILTGVIEKGIKENTIQSTEVEAFIVKRGKGKEQNTVEQKLEMKNLMRKLLMVCIVLEMMTQKRLSGKFIGIGMKKKIIDRGSK